MLSYVPLFCFVLSTVTVTSKADIVACSDEFIVLSEDTDLQSATQAALTQYGAWCVENDQCPYEIDDELLAQMIPLAADPTGATAAVSDLPPIVGSIDLKIGDFFSDPTYLEYEQACKKAGGSITCADTTLVADGTVAIMDNLVVDVLANTFALPLCLPRACESEDLTEVAEKVAKETIKASPDVQAALEAQGVQPTMIDIIDIEFVCTISQLDQCEFKAERVQCKPGRGSSGASILGTAVPVITSLAAAAGTLALAH